MTNFGGGSKPRSLLVMLLLSTFFGCASWMPANQPLVLDDEEVDRLREAGRRLLRGSAAFQELVSELR